MNKKNWSFMAGVVAILAAFSVIGASAKPAAPAAIGNACPPGQCEPHMVWVPVDKVLVDNWVCPPEPYTSTDSTKACRSEHKSGYPSVYHYADKVNQPVLACPGGSVSDGHGGCKKYVQDGWDCNCLEGQHPDGQGHCVPNATATPLPTAIPTEIPTAVPTTAPTEEPTVAPTEEPTVAPTEEPTVAPTAQPTSKPNQPAPETAGNSGPPKVKQDGSPLGLIIALMLVGAASVLGGSGSILYLRRKNHSH